MALRERYQPDGMPPGVTPEAADWLLRELRKVATFLERPRVNELMAEPSKPEAFVQVLADGTQWDPGSGRGIYYWDPSTATWKFVG